MFPMPLFWLQVFCCLLFLGISESTFKPNGANVCSRNQSYMINITRSRNVKVMERYTTKCTHLSGFLWKIIYCTKYRTVPKVQYYFDPATRYKIVYECCNGWITTGDECTIAICNKHGCKNGTCAKPDFCNCNKGYYGPSCGKECPLHKYGTNCLHDCKCKNNATCDSKEGTCDCLEMWTGIFCNESCPRGTFGRNCSQKCNCEKSKLKQDCESKNGKCICRPGYIGKRCQYPCTNHTYGPFCIYKCTCTPNGICAIDTGKCSCLEGYTGKRCEHKCASELTARNNCPKACNCTNNQEKCNKSSKKCSCLPGYNAARCQQRCRQNSKFGPNCQEERSSAHSRARIIHLVSIFGSVGGSFVIIIAVVLVIILRYRRRRGRSSKNTFESGALRVQRQQTEFCEDDTPYVIPMTINNGNNMSDAHQNGVPDEQEESESYYQNVEQLQKEDKNMNDYENVESLKNTFSQQIFEDDSSNTYQELCRQPYEECSHYQSLKKS